MPVVIERMTHIRWARAAVRGRSSLNCTPGTLVAIGRNGPRISIGAAGLGSKVSCCGGPPDKKMIRHDVARGRPASLAAPARPAASVGSPRARQPSPPTRISSRRETGRLMVSGRKIAMRTPWNWNTCRTVLHSMLPLFSPQRRPPRSGGPLPTCRSPARFHPCPAHVCPLPRSGSDLPWKSACFAANRPNRAIASTP